MPTTEDPRAQLTADLAKLQAKRRRTRRNARWAGKAAARHLARELSEEAAESLLDKLPLGLGAAAAAGFAVSDLRKAKRLQAIADDPSEPAERRERAGLEAKIYRRAAALEAASGTVAAVPVVGTAAALGTDGAAVTLETRDRVRLDALGGSVLDELQAEPAPVSRSLKRALQTVDDAITRARSAEAAEPEPEPESPAPNTPRRR